jgi:hypothetical protein
MTVDLPNTLTAAQVEHMTLLWRSEMMGGRPERAQAVREAMDEGQMIELPGFGSVEAEVKPEKVVDSSYIIPPRGGPKGTKSVWVDYALAVSTIEPEVIRGSTRDDIIGMLEARNIIPKKK